jgi:hypothetical protein
MAELVTLQGKMSLIPHVEWFGTHCGDEEGVVL